MSNDEAQVQNLENIIGQTAGMLTQCQKCTSTILDHLGLDVADRKDLGVSQGGSTLNTRIGEVDMLNQQGRILHEDLARIEGELRLL